MKHLSGEIIISYVYGEADFDQMRAVEEHLAGCRECAETVEALKKTAAAMDGLGDEAVPGLLAEKIAAGFETVSPDPAEAKKAGGTEIMTPAELAGYLKVSADTIYGLLSEIPYVTLAGRIRFRRSSIEKWLETREKNPVSRRAEPCDLDASLKLWRNVV